jgi:hypothetical protein
VRTRASIPSVALCAAALALALAGCAGSGPESGGGGGGGGGGQNCANPPPPTVSYAGNIQPIYNRSCATSTACHIGPTSGAALQLQQGVSFGATVNVPSTQQPRLLLVRPGDPDASYLLRKVEGVPGISGLQMPQGCPGAPAGGAVCPTADEITAIRTWIMECAPNN